MVSASGILLLREKHALEDGYGGLAGYKRTETPRSVSRLNTLRAQTSLNFNESDLLDRVYPIREDGTNCVNGTLSQPVHGALVSDPFNGAERSIFCIHAHDFHSDSEVAHHAALEERAADATRGSPGGEAQMAPAAAIQRREEGTAGLVMSTRCERVGA